MNSKRSQEDIFMFQRVKGKLRLNFLNVELKKKKHQQRSEKKKKHSKNQQNKNSKSNKTIRINKKHLAFCEDTNFGIKKNKIPLPLLDFRNKQRENFPDQEIRAEKKNRTLSKKTLISSDKCSIQSQIMNDQTNQKNNQQENQQIQVQILQSSSLQLKENNKQKQTNNHFPSQFNQTNKTRNILGKKIRFMFGNLIGCGSFGQVRRAINVITGEIFAVKRIRIKQLESQQIDNLKKQIEILKGTNHLNIIIDQYLHIYMENMNEGTLFSVIKKYGPLKLNVVKNYTKHIINALIYLHQQKKVIHKDIKSENILMNSQGILKISDFGCSKKFDISSSVFENKSLRGSILWMAPQVLSQINYGRKSDIWSLGCTIIEMITNKLPWSQYQFQNQITALIKITNLNEIPYFPEQTDEDLKEVLLACLQRQIQQRPSAKQLLQFKFFK